MVSNSDIIGIDIGGARIGIARVSPIAKIPEPLKIISADTDVPSQIKKICDEYASHHIVVGIPHNLDGLSTKQSDSIEQFVIELKEFLGSSYTIETVDESLSTVKARELNPRAKYIDDIAAAVILEHYLEEHVSSR